MGSDVNVPPPTAEEKALQREQADLLRFQRETLTEQTRLQDLISPYLFEQLGLQPQYGEGGQISGFQRVEDPLQTLSEEVQKRLLERSKAALAGELPVSPTLTRELTKGEELLNERLRRQLGPGYETSTPGIEALLGFGQRKTEILEGARRGDLTVAEQLGLARGSYNQGVEGQNIGQILGVSQSPLASVGAGTGVVSGYGSAIGGYQNQRAMQLQAAIANSQNSPLGDLFQGLEFLGGSLFGGSTPPWIFA